MSAVLIISLKKTKRSRQFKASLWKSKICISRKFKKNLSTIFARNVKLQLKKKHLKWTFQQKKLQPKKRNNDERVQLGKGKMKSSKNCDKKDLTF